MQFKEAKEPYGIVPLFRCKFYTNVEYRAICKRSRFRDDFIVENCRSIFEDSEKGKERFDKLII